MNVNGIAGALRSNGRGVAERIYNKLDNDNSGGLSQDELTSGTKGASAGRGKAPTVDVAAAFAVDVTTQVDAADPTATEGPPAEDGTATASPAAPSPPELSLEAFSALFRDGVPGLRTGPTRAAVSETPDSDEPGDDEVADSDDAPAESPLDVTDAALEATVSLLLQG